MGPKLEDEVENVEDEENDGRGSREDQDVRLGVLRGVLKNCEELLGIRVARGKSEERAYRCGNDKRCRSHRHQGGHCRRNGRVETLLNPRDHASPCVADTPSYKATAQHQENIGQNASQHAGLHNSDFAVPQCHYTNLLNTS